MIRSREDLKYYLECDRKANNLQKRPLFSLKRILVPNPTGTYLYYLRTYEYLLNAKRGAFRSLSLIWVKYRFKRLSLKLNISIYPNCVAEGLKIAHTGGIIINNKVRAGSHLSIRPFCVIGNKRDGANDEVPTIGNHVQIGANVVIIGKIRIGDHAVIGAGSVVLKDVPDYGIAVGNPARIIGSGRPAGC